MADAASSGDALSESWKRSNYGYRPSLGWGIAFSVCFGLIAVGHLVHVIRSRAIWLTLFAVGAILETIGWVGRTAAYTNPLSQSLFLMQIACLIMGPSWTQAGIYITLWVLVQHLGRHTTPFSPALYLIMCFAADVLCLTLQATGGGLAGAANDAGKSTAPGTITMTVGIVTQLAVAVVFCFLLAIVLRRGTAEIRNPSNRVLVYIAVETIIAIAMMIMRNVYRSIELIQGWRGHLITHEKYVLALDGLPMIISMGIYLIISPCTRFTTTGASGEVAAGSEHRNQILMKIGLSRGNVRELNAERQN